MRGKALSDAVFKSNIRRLEALAIAIGIFGPVGATRFYSHRLFGLRQEFIANIDSMQLKLRSGTPDFMVVQETFGSELEPLRQSLPHDFEGLIVDAGGYIGTAAIKFAQMFPKAQIITIEPSSENFSILSWNVAAFPNITPLKAALHVQSNASISLRRSEKGREWGFSVIEHSDSLPFEDVTTVSLSEIFAKFGESREVGIVKLDIEGAERILFEECAVELRKARVVVAELHDRLIPGCSSAFDEFSRGRTILSLTGEKLVSVR
jgi:FkbM family methyltransferase